MHFVVVQLLKVNKEYMPITPNTYYTSCANIIVGCFLYTDAGYTTPVDPGYYQGNGELFVVNDNLGRVDERYQCPVDPDAPQCDNPDWCCFIGDTLISLKDGSQKSIKNIQPGEIVLSFNESKNQIEENRILSKIGKITDSIVRYTFTNGVVIESTKDHPYYVNGLKIASFDPITTTDKYGFEIDVDLIKIGDIVNLEDGSTSIIESIEELDNLQKVYTLEIENNHNFYANGILVHNKVVPTICCVNVNGGTQNVSVKDCCCLGTGWAPCVTPPGP
jgi:hypothetical protein